MEITKKSLLLTIGLFLCSCFLAAELTPANIFGTVQRKDGSALQGVTFEALSPKLGGKATTMSSENGSFSLLGLAPGVYKLTFVLEGYKTVVRKNIALGMGQTRFLKITMKPGKSENVAAKVKKTPRIDIKGTNMGKSLALQPTPKDRNPGAIKIMTKEVFQTLPRGRNFDSLANIVPGVSSEILLLGGTSIGGASGLENRYYIDGTDTTNILDGSSGQNVSYDFVDDVQVRTSAFNAEFAGALGGVINVITRSGGNEFHGEIIGYYSGAPLRSAYRDILAIDPNDESKAIYLPYSYFNGEDDDHRIESGVNLGGYILKDKLWFFGSIMPVYLTDTRTLTYFYGEVRELRRTENQMNFLAKLTAQPLKGLRLGASVVSNFTKYKGQLPGAADIVHPSIPYEDRGFSYPNISASFSAELTLGDKIMLHTRAGYFRTNQNNQLFQPGNEPVVQFMTEAPGGYFKTTNIGLLDIPVEYQKPIGFQYYPRASASIIKRDIAEQLSMGADLSYFMRFHGEHSLKAGVRWVRRGRTSTTPLRSRSCSSPGTATWATTTATTTAAASTATTPCATMT